jgi:hypothetical protein
MSTFKKLVYFEPLFASCFGASEMMRSQAGTFRLLRVTLFHLVA